MYNVFVRTTAFVLLLSAVAFAQATPSLQFRGPQSGPKHADIAAMPAELSGAAGGKIVLTVDVQPKPGIHVYAPGTKDFIPITLTLDTSADLKPAGKTVYPAATDTLVVVDDKVPVFSKAFKMTQGVTLAKTVKAGSTVKVDGKINLQACDEKVCYPPETVPVSWTVSVK
jgi:DsbC/DsbD-like thiol-disulfide interchange protein